MSEPTQPTPQQVLDTPMRPDNDSGATSIRGYLVALLAALWQEQEGFGGKRPFGNSGWSCELYEPLGRAGYIQCTFDEDGYLDHTDTGAGDKLIASAIQALGAPADAQQPHAEHAVQAFAAAVSQDLLTQRDGIRAMPGGSRAGGLEEAARMIRSLANTQTHRRE
jgi:hypothetical protein